MLNLQVPCILGVNLTDVDLLEFLQQVINKFLGIVNYTFLTPDSHFKNLILIGSCVQVACRYRWIIHSTAISAPCPQ